MKSLKGCRILFICPPTYNYPQEIVKRLRDFYGAIVDFQIDEPIDFTQKISNRFGRAFALKTYSLKYEKDVYDYVWVIKGEFIPVKELHKLRKTQLKAKFILYLWDSIVNCPNSIKIAPIFDKVYSFDRDDCDKYKFAYQPLFFIAPKLNEKSNKNTLELSFIGGHHSDRYEILSRLKIALSKHQLSYDFRLFVKKQHLFSLYLRHKLNLDTSILIKKKISYRETLQVYQDSNVIVDIHHPNQSGLTMRTIEAIGNGKKLLTTNSAIKKEPFYTNSMISVFDRKDIHLDSNFFLTDSKRLNINHLEITNWIYFFFNQENF